MAILIFRLAVFIDFSLRSKKAPNRFISERWDGFSNIIFSSLFFLFTKGPNHLFAASVIGVVLVTVPSLSVFMRTFFIVLARFGPVNFAILAVL